MKSYKDMYLQTPKQTITETDTRPLKTHKHKTLRGRNSLPVVGPVSRNKDKDKDMNIKTKTYTQMPDNATCLSREARSIFMEIERRGHPTIMRWLTLRKKIILHISQQFFNGIHLPENQLYYADQQEMGWKKNQENMENSKHILASLHVFFFIAVATETKTFVIKNDDM